MIDTPKQEAELTLENWTIELAIQIIRAEKL